MATFFCVSFNSISHPSQLFPSFFRAPAFPNPPLLLRIPGGHRKQGRGLAVVAGAGPPSMNSIIFAIALPSSLLAVTILAALKMGDKLDQQWVQEIAKTEALKEVEDDDNDNDDGNGEEDSMENYVQEEPALSRARNRPKREA